MVSTVEADFVLPLTSNKPGMIIGRAPTAADGIRQTQLGPNILEQPSGKAAAENVRHHRQRREIRVAAARRPDGRRRRRSA